MVRKTTGKVNMIVTNFMRLLIIIAFFGAYQTRPLLSAFLIITLLASFLPTIMNKYFKTKVRGESQIFMLIVVYGVLFLSEVRGFYTSIWWDVLLNCGAAIIVSFIGLTIIYSLHQDKFIDTSPFMVVLLSFSLSFSIGGIWEIFRYLADFYLEFNFQKIGTGNPITDLSVFAITAFVISLSGYLYMKNSRNNILSTLVMNFIIRNPKIFKPKKDLENPSQMIKSIIQKGESSELEFKSTLRKNLHTNEKDRRIELAVLKTISAYLNTNGGTLLVGVNDNGKVIGIEEDEFENHDKLKLHLSNLIKYHIGKQFFNYINFELFPIEDKHILKIDCSPSDRRVFLKDGKEEEFYIRNGPATSRLFGNALIEYIKQRFE